MALVVTFPFIKTAMALQWYPKETGIVKGVKIGYLSATRLAVVARKRQEHSSGQQHRINISMLHVHDSTLA